MLEIANSFKPDTIASFSVDRMDQINIDSDDEEVKEMVKVKTKVKVYPLKKGGWNLVELRLEGRWQAR